MAWFDFLRWGRKSASNFDVLRELAGLWRRSSTGKVVNVETAIRVSTVFACARVIGNGMAQVPLKLMRESKDGKSRLPAKDHPLYEILALRPNPWQTSYEYRQTLSWHVELCGNAFSFINRSSRGESGEILELIPFEPNCVTVKRADDRTLSYEVRAKNGKVQVFPAAAIWHLRGPSWDSWMGLDVLKTAREAIGLAMATEESQGTMHKNQVRPSGVYSVEGTLKDDQYKALRAWIDREHTGPEKDGNYMLMDRSAKWMSTQMTGVDAQHLETRKHQIEEVCRHMGVMPIMVGYSDKAATYASAEQMFLAHVVHCLSPRWTAFEQSVDANLLTDKERLDGLYSDFVDEAMIRGSVKDTKDAIVGYIAGGVMTQNEGRAKLDLNPDKDPESDKLHLPVNLLQPAEAPEPDPAVTKSIDEIRAEVKGLQDRPPAPIHVDARTTIEKGAVQVAPANVTVTSPEVKAPDVKVEIAAPIVNVAPAELAVTLQADGRSSTTTYKRDPDTQEITSSTTTKE